MFILRLNILQTGLQQNKLDVILDLEYVIFFGPILYA